jgi:acyl carrier protein
MTGPLDGIEERIREFLCTELGYGPEEIPADGLLFSSGMVDSFTFVSMVAMIEGAIGMAIDPRDITVENFDSIERIAAFLRAATR